jgi:hypothetical protein
MTRERGPSSGVGAAQISSPASNTIGTIVRRSDPVRVQLRGFSPAPAGWGVQVECADRELPSDRRAFRSPVVGWALVSTLYGDGERNESLEAVWVDEIAQLMTRPEYARLHDAECVAVFVVPPGSKQGDG